MATKADRYEEIDGLKAYAIIGIALRAGFCDFAEQEFAV